MVKEMYRRKSTLHFLKERRFRIPLLIVTILGGLTFLPYDGFARSPTAYARSPNSWNFESKIKCKDPFDVETSCHMQNVCYDKSTNEFIYISQDPSDYIRLNGKWWIASMIHRQPLWPARMHGWAYDYGIRTKLRVMKSSELSSFPPPRWIEEQVLFHVPANLHHYGHTLMDNVFPVFKLMYRHNRLDYNSRIFFLVRTGSESANEDVWKGVSKNRFEYFEDVQNAYVGETLCFRNALSGPGRVGAFGDDIQHYDHFAFRDFAVSNMGINVPEPTKPTVIYSLRPCNTGVTRCLTNERELVDMLTNSFPDMVEVKAVDFRGVPFRHQVELLQSGTIFMGVSGTTTHNAFFLRNGSALSDLVPSTKYHGQAERDYNVNKFICDVNSPSIILCNPFWVEPVTDMTKEQLYTDPDMAKIRHLDVKAELLRIKFEFYENMLNSPLNKRIINALAALT